MTKQLTKGLLPLSSRQPVAAPAEKYNLSTNLIGLSFIALLSSVLVMTI